MHAARRRSDRREVRPRTRHPAGVQRRCFRAAATCGPRWAGPAWQFAGVVEERGAGGGVPRLVAREMVRPENAAGVCRRPQ